MLTAVQSCPCVHICRAKVSQEHLGQLLNPDLVLQTLLSWQDVKGVTALMLAARGGHAECLELLLQYGADPLLLDSVNRRWGWKDCLMYILPQATNQQFVAVCLRTPVGSLLPD
jgi:hypothetical protein